MKAAVCAPLFALAAWSVAPGARGQAELPAIFAPRPAPAESEGPATAAPPPRSTLRSEHLRAAMHDAAQRVLENAAVFDAPRGQVTIDPTSGVAVLTPVVVQGRSINEALLRPRTIELGRFRPVGGDKHRRMAGGVTAPLWRGFYRGKELQLNLSVFNLAGNGIDHNIDFARVELAFTIKW